MRPAFYDDPSYRKKQSEITKRYSVLHPRTKKFSIRDCNNRNCNLTFKLSRPSDPKLYCGHSCAASLNNRKRIKNTSYCISCNEKLSNSSTKYCSIVCQNNHRFTLYISRWKIGLESGSRGINSKNISKFVKRFLLEKYGKKCSKCSWSQINPTTNVVPLEINHIDGDSENNQEENLELICPNCHSLTSSFRNLNKGKGRAWRLKYLKKLN